jgi:hypothetical protein
MPQSGEMSGRGYAVWLVIAIRLVLFVASGALRTHRRAETAWDARSLMHGDGVSADGAGD